MSNLTNLVKYQTRFYANGGNDSNILPSNDPKRLSKHYKTAYKTIITGGKPKQLSEREKTQRLQQAHRKLVRDREQLRQIIQLADHEPLRTAFKLTNEIITLQAKLRGNFKILGSVRRNRIIKQIQHKETQLAGVGGRETVTNYQQNLSKAEGEVENTRNKLASGNRYIR